jgi:MarR family transcriptional regulator, temperature-dependent positive regulator of motility
MDYLVDYATKSRGVHMGDDSDLTFNRFISIISRCSQIYFDRELRPANIGAAQIRILRALAIQDGISQERIRLLFHLDKGTVAKTIKPLIREAYIQREKNPEDQRAYRIFLTARGRSILPRLRQAARRWSDTLTAGFSAEEKRAINDLLSRMSENARAHLIDKSSTPRGESLK